MGRKYTWGRSLDSNKANYGEEIGDTTPVGTYDMNGYGLYDMAGNVWEWCLDEYDADFYPISPRRNPLAGGTVNGILSNWIDISSVRVLRGGSWVSNAKFVRVSDRTRFTPQQRSWIPLCEVCNTLVRDWQIAGKPAPCN